MSGTRPWHDHKALSDTLAHWRESWSGRALFRVSAGPGWLRLNFEGDDRAGLYLIAMPAANLVFASHGSLPEPLHQALVPTRKHPVQRLLSGCTLDSMGMLANDNVAAFALTDSDGQKLVLLHRLFGSRSNTVVLDMNRRLHWSLHRPPHSLLAEVPKKSTWKTGSPLEGDTISEAALNQLISRLILELQSSLTSRLNRQKATALRLVDNLERDLKNANRGEEFRRQAEALAANLHLIKQGLAVFETTDLRDGSPISIPLKPAISPSDNMNNLFRKARKAEKGRQIIQDRLTEAETSKQHLLAVHQSLEELTATTTDQEPLSCLSELQQWGNKHPEFLPSHEESGGRRDKTQASSRDAQPFRRYLIDGRWKVWVGRNNKENDKLTHQAAQPRDLWFHAQGVPGSHVILRTEGDTDNIPRKVLEKAASLAALHSKAKHAGIVPVIWTERRYVRKPRKSLPGTAVCIQEKSLFVEPGVPEGVALSD
jgi:hypothetical protein